MMNKWLYVITIRIMFLVRKGQNSGGLLALALALASMKYIRLVFCRYHTM